MHLALGDLEDNRPCNNCISACSQDRNIWKGDKARWKGDVILKTEVNYHILVYVITLVLIHICFK